MKTALVVPGGGTRNSFVTGVFSGSGFRLDQVDALFTCSSGAPTLAYALTGQLEESKRVWIKELTSRRVFSWRRTLQGRLPADVDALIDHACRTLRWSALDDVATRLFVGIFRRRDGATLYRQVTAQNARDLFKATCGLPLLARPTCLEGDVYLDGGTEHALPVRAAIERGYRNIVVIENQPPTFRMSAPTLATQLLAFPDSIAARAAFARRHEQFAAERRLISCPPAGVTIERIVPQTTLPVGRFSHSQERVRDTILHGEWVGRAYAARDSVFSNAI